VILIIDNYDSFTYNLFQLIAGLITTTVEVVRNDKIDIATIRQKKPQCIILSPGPGYPDKSGVCLDIIKHLGGGIPILGVCLGHQAIAYVHGAKIIKAIQPLHGKARNIYHKSTMLFNGVSKPFLAARYHSLIIDEASLPEDFFIDAYDDNHEIMAISHKNKPTYGIQFHPESILTPEGDIIIRNFLEIANVKTIPKKTS
jgi:anthranilate synthase/aminodeoxychorismate synthase-like glutamine amidotransferase